MPTTLRDIPALSVRAAVEAKTLNHESRTVDVTWSTGSRVRRGFWEPFDEELSMNPKHVRMERLASGRAPVLDNHNGFDGTSAVRGVVQSAKVDGKIGTATLRFAKAEDDEDGGKLFRKIADGIIANVSVGYRVHKMELVEAGDAQSGVVPVYRATDWEPYEISAVGIGADAGAGFRSADAHTNRCEFVSRSAPEETMIPKPSVEPENPVPPAPAPAPATPPEPTPPDAARLIAAEQTRSLEIRKLVRRAKLDESFAEKLIADNATLDASRSAVGVELVAREEKIDPHHRMEITDDTRDKRMRGMMALLIHRSGLDELFTRAKKTGNKAFEKIDLDPGEFRGMTFLELARRCLEDRGAVVRGIEPMAMVGAAMGLDRAGGMQTTSDFPLLLAATVEKTLLAAYATAPDTWEEFCGTTSVQNFNPHSSYGFGSIGRLDKVNEHGEFKNKAIPDGAGNTIQAKTYGNIIGLTRQAIVNDDLGVFSRIATQAGRAAKLSIELEVYDLLALNAGLGPVMADTLTFFHADHGNIGVGSALGVAGIDADRVSMASQMDDQDNEILDIRPSVLLLPVGLGGAARILNQAQFDPDASQKYAKPNAVAGLFAKVIDTPRLTGTRRYMFADPNSGRPAFVVSFLNGQREPVVETQQGWRIDGTEWKVRLDFGVDAVNPHSAVTNAGA